MELDCVRASMSPRRLFAHLFAVGRIEQHPANLDRLGRVFCDIDTMLVAGGGYVDDDVALEASALLGGHLVFAGSSGLSEWRSNKRRKGSSVHAISLAALC